MINNINPLLLENHVDAIIRRNTRIAKYGRDPVLGPSKEAYEQASKAVAQGRAKRKYNSLSPIKKLFTSKPDTWLYDGRLGRARAQGPHLPA